MAHLLAIVRREAGFLRRQTTAYKLMVTRRMLHALANALSLQYNSLYATLLGASPVQLGSLQSVGNAVGALASLPAGHFIDFYGLRKVLLLGTGFLLVSRVVYAAAPSWMWLYLAIVLYYLGMRLTCTACSVNCAAELQNQDRATGRGFCHTVVSPLTIVSPILAAALITRLGGIRVESLRPIYGIETVIFAGIFLLLFFRLSGQLPANRQPAYHGLRSEFAEVFRQGPDVVRLIWIMGLSELPWVLTQTFVPVYAHEFKGASQFVLGGIAIANTLVPMVFSLPLGRLADRLGRKKVLFAIAPLTNLGNLCLLLAPASGLGSSLLLLLYGVLFGFNSINMVLVSSMAAEVMPKEHMGRWLGVIGLFRGLMGIPVPLMGGLIWEHLGPHFVFLTSIGIDVLLRLPILARTRETLQG